MSEEIDNGGDAFPGQYPAGMSLRDYFAGQALAGLMVGVEDPIYRTLAEMAYMQAEMMLVERRIHP